MSLAQDLKTIRDLISKHEPCQHQTSDFSLGDGKTWAKCEDCGLTYHRETFEKKASSQMMAFRDAYDALDRLEVACKSVDQDSKIFPVEGGGLVALSDILALAQSELEKLKNGKK